MPPAFYCGKTPKQANIPCQKPIAATVAKFRPQMSHIDQPPPEETRPERPIGFQGPHDVFPFLFLTDR